MPVFSAGRKTHSSLAFSAEASDDPLFYLTGADFKKQVGKEFLLTCETGAVIAVLKNVSQIEAAKTGNSAKGNSQQPIAEIFTLSFQLPVGGFKQASYRVRNQKLGEFDLFLVPEARNNFLLYAVINRI